MTLQLALAVTLLLGLPLLLLAVGVLAHAYVLSSPSSGAVPEGLVEAMVAESVDQLLAQLRSVPPEIERLPASVSPSQPLGVAAFPPFAVSPLSVATSPSGANLARAVAQLVSEGLSDRSIARRLSVGIEEVRFARSPQGVSR